MFSLKREEEEEGGGVFCSLAISLCVGHWFKKNELKDKLCNSVLLYKHVRALPLTSARMFGCFGLWVMSGGGRCNC